MIELKQVRKAYVEGDSRHIVLDNLELLIEKGAVEDSGDHKK